MEVQNKYLAHVRGITCSMCIQKLENVELYDSPVTDARVYFGQSLLQIVTSKPVESQWLLNQIKKIGFKAEILEDKQATFEAAKKSNREHLAKLGVAGFCAGNIMLATIPIYSGADSIYKMSFAYLSFLLFLPVLLFSSLDFYKNAWRSIKSKSLSIDLPITAAMLLGFVFSTWNLFNNHLDYLYYDSTASFLFLILSARYFLAKLQQNFVATYSENDFGLQSSYEVIGSGVFKAKEELSIGDRIKIHENQTLPAKCKILSITSEWNCALISGESYPQLFHTDMTVDSGAVLVSKECEVEILETYFESRIYNFQNKLEDIKKTKSEFVHFTDRFSHYFIVSIFLISATFFLFYYRIDPFQAFQRSLALLIVACPCALALGTPMAYLLGVYRTKQKGILIYKKDIFDRLLLVKNIFFDKTGTLTHGQLAVKNNNIFDSSPISYINILLNLEKDSNHPIAFALRKKYAQYYSPLNIEVTEVPGRGVQGSYNGSLFEFLKETEGDEVSSSFYMNKIKVFQMTFEDSIREDSATEIKKLSARGKTITLLTGDKKSVAAEVAATCGLTKVYSDQTPEMKATVIQDHQPALMVGDGFNDVLSLKKASVGIAVQGSVQLSADSSDAYFLKPGISQLNALFDIANAVKRTIFSNLGISLIYNLVAGTFALMGFINPLVAAILMPISSVAILANTLRGVR